MEMEIICGEGHKVAEKVHCPYCDGPLNLGGRSTEKQTVAVCDRCWKKPNNYQRNITIRDIMPSLKIKKCSKCGTQQFFFKKE